MRAKIILLALLLSSSSFSQSFLESIGPQPRHNGYYQLKEVKQDIRLILNENQQFYYFRTSNKEVTIATGVYFLCDSLLLLDYVGEFFIGEYSSTQGTFISNYEQRSKGMDSDTFQIMKGSLMPFRKVRNSQFAFVKSENVWADSLLPQYEIHLLQANYEHLIQMKLPFQTSYDSLIGKRLLWMEDMHYYAEGEGHFERLNGGMSRWAVVYPEDSVFKIFTISGEGCGAHCNGSYTDYIQFQNGNFRELFLSEINQVYKISDSLYLIKSSGWGGGTSGSTGISMSLFRLDGDQLLTQELILSDSTKIDESLWDYDHTSLAVSSLWFMPCGPSLSYDPIHKRITFESDYSSFNEIPEEAYALLPPDFERNQNVAYCFVGSCNLERNLLSNCSYHLVFNPE